LPLGAHLAEIMAAAVGAVDAENAVRRNLRIENDFLVVADNKTLDLREIERIFVVGAGKAGAAMAKAADEILGDLIDAGLVIVKDGHAEKSNYGRIEIAEAAHPVPDERAVENSRKLLSLVENSTENDLVLVLISGGGSAVSTLPAGNIELADLRFLTGELLRCGATIGEINCLRKHLTVLAGGGLAEIAFPAKICSLIISDVVGSPLDVIASGMTAPDSTTFADAWRIVEKLFEMQKPARSKGENDCGLRIADFGFEDWLTIHPKSEIENPKSEGTLTSCVFPQFSEMQKPARSKGAKDTLPQVSDLPESIERHLLRGLRGEIADTPKADAEIWRNVSNFIVADNRLAADSAVAKAREFGFDAEILTCSLEGEASAVGAMIAEIAARRAAEPREKPFLLVAGGETTVTIRGTGRGGRNQELALGAVEKISGLENVVLATLATDGGDGTADAAGAVADGKTLEKAFEKNLIPADFLRRNDSYNFFEPLGALIKTGATLTNVNDLLFLLITPREDFR
jgi:glycerate 2-kinase